MKKLQFILFTTFIAIHSAFAVEKLDKELPQCYKILRDSVYMTSTPKENVDANYENVIAYAKETYGNSEENKSELLTLLSMCDYMKGLDGYYRKDKKRAVTFLDSSIENAKKSMEIKKTASNITVYAKALFQRADYDRITFGLKWIPKIMDICDQAIKINPDYTAAYQMKYAILCYIPSPYGNYKEGAVKMASLLDEKWIKEKDDFFSINASLAYAYEKTNRKDKAKTLYLKALTYYPDNLQVKEALKGFK